MLAPARARRMIWLRCVQSSSSIGVSRRRRLYRGSGCNRTSGAWNWRARARSRRRCRCRSSRRRGSNGCRDSDGGGRHCLAATADDSTNVQVTAAGARRTAATVVGGARGAGGGCPPRGTADRGPVATYPQRRGANRQRYRLGDGHFDWNGQKRRRRLMPLLVPGACNTVISRSLISLVSGGGVSSSNVNIGSVKIALALALSFFAFFSSSSLLLLLRCPFSLPLLGLRLFGAGPYKGLNSFSRSWSVWSVCLPVPSISFALSSCSFCSLV